MAGPDIKRVGHVDALEQGNPYNLVDRRLFKGLVTDVFQWLHCYEVSIGNGMSLLGAALGGSSQHNLGLRDHTMYQVGTEVLCYREPGSSTCLILGSLPPRVGFPGYNICDWIHSYSSIGLLNDPPHTTPIGMPGQLENFNNGRPYDAMPGEFGLTSPLGVGLHASMFTTMLRAGDMNGIWAFYLNQLTRLAGYNFQLWTAIRQLEEGDNRGEGYRLEVGSPYPWEMLGARQPDVAGVIEPHGESANYDPETGLDPLWAADQQQARLEPAFPDQCPVQREITLGGYAGDLSRTQVCCPPATMPDGVDRSSVPTDYIGLSEVARGLDGTVEVRSRRSIILERAAYIAVPRRLKPADDPAGDGDEYRAAGQYGEGDEHDVTPFEGASPEVSVAQLFDRLAWNRHRIGLQALHRHEKDWHLSAELDTEGHAGASIDHAVYETGNAFRAPIPAAARITLDHRPGSTRDLYKSRAAVYLGERGEVVLEDGWGSQIVMDRGNIILSCQGDVIVANGRNFTVMAPNDINLRAGANLDASAGRGDLRLKAERNLQALAGNSGAGGMLLESRGAGFTQDYASKYGTDVRGAGVVIKATAGAANIIGDQVYIRATDSGSVILDADNGNGTVQVYAGDLYELVNARITMFGVRPGFNDQPESVEYHDASNVSFGQDSSFSVNAQIIGASGATFDGNLLARAAATQAGGQLGKWDVTTRAAVNTALARVRSLQSTAAAKSTAPREGVGPYAEGNGIGQDATLEQLGFSFRLDDQYGLDFGEEPVFLPEARWQQMFRVLGKTLKWSEPTVTSPDGAAETMPFPGFANWTSTPLFRTVDLAYWSHLNGEKGALTDYGEPTGGSVSSMSLSDGYLVKYQA